MYLHVPIYFCPYRTTLPRTNVDVMADGGLLPKAIVNSSFTGLSLSMTMLAGNNVCNDGLQSVGDPVYIFSFLSFLFSHFFFPFIYT